MFFTYKGDSMTKAQTAEHELIVKIDSGQRLVLQDLRNLTVSQLETLCLSLSPSNQYRIMETLDESSLFGLFLDVHHNPLDPKWERGKVVRVMEADLTHDPSEDMGIDIVDSGWQESLDDCFARLKDKGSFNIFHPPSKEEDERDEAAFYRL
jgi:hypothetical protein